MKIIECPRDAIQGIKRFIPTEKKVAYLNKLLKIGFDTIDFGSFVSPAAIPQMADTAEVLDKLETKGSSTSLLAIVANIRGAEASCHFDQISYLGYPFSISETFQLRNTRATISRSADTVKGIQDLCQRAGKQLVVYISMAFGNPYGDIWNAEIALQWIEQLKRLGIRIFSLADTIGAADPAKIEYLFTSLISQHPELEFGAHFHTRPDNWHEKLEAAWNSGCRRFDGAILGYGGCPMAQDQLVGNMATENILQFMEENGVENGIDRDSVSRLAAAFKQMIVN